MGTVQSFMATVTSLVRLGHHQKNDVLVFLGNNPDIADLQLRDIVSQADHVAAAPVNELPVHERFHVADVEDAGEEIGDEEPAAWAKHLEHGPGKTLGGGQRQIIEQARRVDKIKLSQLNAMCQQLADAGRDGFDAKTAVRALDFS